MEHLLPPRWARAPLAFSALTLAMFYDVLFTSQRVVSARSADLAMQFIPWREFGFTQLAHGHLPLWNPHIYGGAPYFAGFQAALLYPPNWLHLILPVAVAINWIVALHVWLAGYFTYLWCRSRAIGIGGSILAGMMFMFSGPYFLHLYAGHLPHLAVMVWTPLMLLAIDKLAETANPRWSLLGVAATAIHILGGHPQYVYYTGLALSLYTALRLIDWRGWRRRLAVAGGFVVMYLGAALLTAIQLLPGIQAAGESVRSGGTSYAFASTFSLPPENLITLLVPGFFGNEPLAETVPASMPYWGAGYLWEMSLFASVSGLALAVLGAIRGPRRAVWVAGIMIVLSILLALGRHTPLYRWMFDFLPGYSSFRGSVKFAYLSGLFISLLAAMGFDSLLRQSRVAVVFCGSVVLLAIALAGTGAGISVSAAHGSDSIWAGFIGWISESARLAQESFTKVNPGDAAFLAASGRHAATLTYLAAGTLAMVALLLWASRFFRFVPAALIVIAGAELSIYARSTRATMNPADAVVVPDPWKPSLARLRQEDRVLTVPLDYANLGMSLGFDNLAGYDPGVLKRYAELIYASQGLNPSQASQYLPFRQPSPSVFRMLRCGLVCFDPTKPPMLMPGALPVAVLVSDWVQIKSRDAELSYLTRGSFDPWQTAVLEAEPPVTTVASATPPGAVHVLAQTSDSVELQAELSRPAILVVTNNFSTGWRVMPLASAQPQYQIMPANYTQLGIPLQSGKHHLLIEYSPLAYRVGRWISLCSLGGFVVTAGMVFLRRSSISPTSRCDPGRR